MRDAIVHVVDDEVEICRSTALVLQLAGFRCATWTSGEAFLEGADLHASGCVILDLRMPGLDGLATLKSLRERGSAQSVIVVSGHGDLAVARGAVEAGAAEFIEKPYDAERLVTRLEGLLA